MFEPIRLTAADQPRCSALAIDREWGPEEHKWRFLFRVGEVYGLEDGDGELVATTVLTRYGQGLAAISMVLVASRYEGRGLGRRIMEHAMAAGGDAVLTLYATGLGRPLYEKLGFRTVTRAITHVGEFRPEPADPSDEGIGSRPAAEADLPGLLALDAPAFGADRGQLIEGLFGFADRLRVITDRGRISGYAGAWRNDTNTVIGPVVAAEVTEAQRLIAEVAAGVPGPVRLDLDDLHPSLQPWATAHGVGPAFETSIMVYGGELPGDRERLFLPVMQALG
jgi:GNAT superfamily N-acetyltransferase